jgi:hypothetical protein
MMEAVRTSETSIDNQFTRLYIPEDNSELQFVTHFRMRCIGHPWNRAVLSEAHFLPRLLSVLSAIHNYLLAQCSSEGERERGGKELACWTGLRVVNG